MGWSCEGKAGRTMERIYRLHGKDALYHYQGRQYFFEASSREYEDGHITMNVYMCIDERRCRKSGTFKILPSGELSKNVLGIKGKIEEMKREEA
jgi:hypothetical protein